MYVLIQPKTEKYLNQTETTVSTINTNKHVDGQKQKIDNKNVEL